MLKQPKKFILASFLTLLITYIIPANSANTYISNYGFPIEFLSLPSNLSTGNSLLQSINFNFLGFTLNITIFYFLITIIENQLKKINY